MNQLDIVHPYSGIGKLVLAALLAAALLLGSASTAGAADAASFEAESFDYGSFASVTSDSSASGGEALKFTSAGTATKRVTITGATAVLVKARGPVAGGKRADLEIKLDGTTLNGNGTTLTSDAYAEYRVAKVLAAGTYTIGIRAKSATSNRPLFADVYVLEGGGEQPPPPPPSDTDGDGVPDDADECDTEAGPSSNNGCPESSGGGDGGIPAGWPAPSTGGSTHPQGFRPADGSVLVNPKVTCSGDPEGGTSGPTGFSLSNSKNITLINPESDNCQIGYHISGSTDNVRIVSHSAYTGYANPRADHNRTAIKVDGGQNIEIGDVSASSCSPSDGARFVNQYRGVWMQSATNVDIHHTKQIGKAGVFGSAAHPGQITGIKYHPLHSAGPQKVMQNSVWECNLVDNVFEEGMSVDARNRSSDSATREQDSVGAVSAANDTVTLASGSWTSNSTNYTGYHLAFSGGTAAGESLRITSRSGKVFSVADPENVLAGVSAGDKVGVSMLFRDGIWRENLVDIAGGKVAYDLHGNTFHSRFVENVAVGNASWRYSSVFNLPNKAICLKASSQANVSTTGSATGVVRRSPVMSNSFVSNDCSRSGVFALHLITWGSTDGGDAYSSPNYWQNNTGGAYSEHYHRQSVLASDPTGS